MKSVILIFIETVDLLNYPFHCDNIHNYKDECAGMEEDNYDD
jgi:hypothetical protein